MKVCLVNLFDLDPPRNGGLSRVAYTVSELLAQLDEQEEIKVFFAVGWRFSGEFRNWLGRAGGEIIPVMPEAGLTPIFQNFKPDLVISPLFGMSPCADWDAYRHIPHIATMPDALALDKPDLFEDGELQKRREVYDQLRNATKVVTISAHARQSLINHLGLKEEQILVIPLAGELSAKDSYRESSRKEWNFVSPYIFYPARNWPHKRHELLLNAMKEISQARGDLQLVLTGWQDEGAIAELAQKCKLPREKIIELSYVTNEKLISLYHHAEALMFISEYEGFGMPILEAMQNGCPVICAPLTSMPEVAGDAALYVDSDDPKDWAQAFLEKLPGRKTALIQKGYEQAKKFSWNHTQALWRKLILDELAKIIPQYSPTMPYFQELSIWASHFKAAQEEMYQKERAIQNLLSQMQEKERAIQNLLSQMQEKERAIQNLLSQNQEKESIIQWFRGSLRYWLLNGPFRHIPLFARLTTSAFNIRARFMPKLGVYHQHPPRPMHLPSWYKDQPRLPEANLPLISIVTPSYNQADYLERTITSILSQGYPKLEYIIQDGNSTDGSTDILERYRVQLKHVESVRDGGQANAINLGMRHVTGEIMAYLNSDDMLLPGTLHYVAGYFARHPNVDVVYGHRIIVDENDQEVGIWVLPPHDKKALAWADYIPQETMFWRRSIWEKSGGRMDESFQFALDWDLLIRFEEAGARIVRLPRFLAAFRVHDAQKSTAQIHERGVQEMSRIRAYMNKREVTNEEINRHIRPYLWRSIWYHKLYRLGLLRY